MLYKLGQHFLINKAAIKKIVAVLSLKPKDTVIEIGPGKGALTEPLIKECLNFKCKVIAVEKDLTLIHYLNFKYKNIPVIKVTEGDILNLLPSIPRQLKNKKYKLVGNIPYYITGQLLRILSELNTKPIMSVLMLQKEVAERIAAKPPKMNLLAAAMQFWAEPKILFNLKSKDFQPPPKVNSAVIKLIPRLTKFNIKPDIYYKIMHIIFKQPRKTLLNNLHYGLKMPKDKIEKALKTIKINPKSRPQNLSVKNCSQIARLFML